MNFVGTEFEDGVLTVTLRDEENRNALSVGLTSELAQTLDEAEANPDVRVIVLTNSGRVFCAGADLSERSSRKKNKSQTKPVDPSEIFSRFRKSSKPNEESPSSSSAKRIASSIITSPALTVL